MHLRVRLERKQMIDCDDDMLDISWYACKATTLEALRCALMARAETMNKLGPAYHVKIPEYTEQLCDLHDYDPNYLPEHVMKLIDAFPYRIGRAPWSVTAVERVHFANEALTMAVRGHHQCKGVYHLIDFRLNFGLILPVVDWPADEEQRRVESCPNNNRKETA